MRQPLTLVTNTFRTARDAPDVPFGDKLSAGHKASKAFQLVEELGLLSGIVSPFDEEEQAARIEVEKDLSALLRQPGGQGIVTAEGIAASLQALNTTIQEFRTSTEKSFKEMEGKLVTFEAKFITLEKKIDHNTWKLEAFEARTTNNIVSYVSSGYKLEEVPSPSTGARLPEGTNAALTSDTQVLSLREATVDRWLAFYGINVPAELTLLQRRSLLLRWLCLK